MSENTKTRAKNLIWGALVADAAAMGLHWIYDQDHIQKIAPSNPEFRKPNVANYEGVPAFFAHGSRAAGEQSQYGEQALVMLRSLTATSGQFDIEHYSQSFRNHFGYGGNYVGYIDHATRETLNNFIRAEDEAKARAKTVPFTGEESITSFLTGKALAITNQYSPDSVNRKFEEAVRIKHNDDSIVEYGLKILEQIQSMDTLSGSVDEQFPATAKLPALVAITKAKGSSDDSAFYNIIDSAIKVTNMHERAFTYGHTSARLMEATVKGENLIGIVQAALQSSTPEVATALELALSMKSDSTEQVTKHFGMACDLKYGVPSITHNIATSSSFEEAIQKNIYAGGDSCGRSIILGAVLGGHYGVGGEKGIPEDWINQLSAKNEVESLLTEVLGM